MRNRRLLFIGTLLIGLHLTVGVGQETGPTVATETAPAGEAVRSISTAKSLLDAIAVIQGQIAEKRQARSEKNLAPAERAAIEQEIEVLNKTLSEQELSLESVLTGVDLKSRRDSADTSVQLEEELRQLLQPLVRELKKLTAKPRETEALRESLASLNDDRAIAEQAVLHLEGLQRAASDDAMKKVLSDQLAQWKARYESAVTQLKVAQYQLEERSKRQETIFGQLSNGFTSFFRSRGRNALGALGLGVATFLLLHFIHRQVHRLSPLRKRGRRSLFVRFVDVGYYLFTISMAMLVALTGLYMMGDWLLLGLSLIFVAGILWASKQSLTLFFEQVRLMLNLGSVREGERLIFNGIPWEVKSIKLYTDLINPKLRGGHLRVPLKDVTSLVSREPDDDEYLFPCSEGDWLLLSDGTFGKVLQQSPEWVQLVLLGGSRKNYPTADFLTMGPQSLSTGYRIEVRFGVDYQHQAISADKIPTLMQLYVEQGLKDLLAKNELQHLRVELAEAAASSLNYAVIADILGSAASKYTLLQRALHRLCIEACNKHGWTIPFTQITLHQALPATTEPSDRLLS